MKTPLTTLTALALMSCAPAIADEPIQSIYWSDADSGRIDGVKFRLANVDAPETGSMKMRGGAKCELERERGYESKAWIVSQTKDKAISISNEYGYDRYDRLVVDLSVNGRDLGELGVRAGALKDCPHKNGRALAGKPDWCVVSEGAAYESKTRHAESLPPRRQFVTIGSPLFYFFIACCLCCFCFGIYVWRRHKHFAGYGLTVVSLLWIVSILAGRV